MSDEWEHYVTSQTTDEEFDFYTLVIMDNFPQYRYDDVAELSYITMNKMLNYIRTKNKANNPENQNRNKGVSVGNLQEAINKLKTGGV